MRILHIDKFLDPSALETHGGTCTVVRALSNLQRQAGHDVKEFYPRIAGATTDLPGFVDYTRGGAANICRMIHDFDAADKLRRFLREHPVDVAHLHSIYHHLTPSILPVLAAARVPMVMTLHDYRMACPTKNFQDSAGLCTRCHPHRYYLAARAACAGASGAALAIESYVQRLARRYFSHIDFFLCPSDFLAGVLRQVGAPASKVITAPNPIWPMEVVEPQSERPMLLFAGRLVHQKDPAILLELASRVRDVQIVIAGGGPMLESLIEQSRRLNLANVLLPGQLGRDDLAAQLGRCHALVLPSKCYENSPLSLLEAMSASRCVIAADQPPLQQWVNDGVTGRFFRAGDVESLQRVVTEVLGDATARDAMAARGNALVRRLHDDGRVLEQVIGIYELAIRRSRWRI
ncbi:MAG: glycosyltransferase family 4 protein [Planctomycetes bacterium]|nr:glycosyltransferase family 4 protein [Planctomycetota bacterium]